MTIDKTWYKSVLMVQEGPLRAVCEASDVDVNNEGQQDTLEVSTSQ